MIRLPRALHVSLIVLTLMLGPMNAISVSITAAQVRPRKGLDPQTQLLNNYRKYVDRYIRISDETWKYNDTSLSATHSFSIKNIAGVAYSDIELRVNYMNASGKSLQTSVLKIPGTLAAYTSKKFANLKVQKVPRECDQAVLTVTKATIAP
jgi:hypothetical protein